MAAESTQADFVGQESPFGEDADTFKDLCTQAVWSVSGAKPGNGVDQLIDDDVRCWCLTFKFSRELARFFLQFMIVLMYVLM